MKTLETLTETLIVLTSASLVCIAVAVVAKLGDYPAVFDISLDILAVLLTSWAICGLAIIFRK